MQNKIRQERNPFMFKMACPVRLLITMLQIDLLHCPINAEIVVGDRHPDLRILF